MPAFAGPYVIHTHGMTGYQFGEAKRKEVLRAGIEVMEEATAFRLLTGSGGEVCVPDAEERQGLDGGGVPRVPGRLRPRAGRRAAMRPPGGPCSAP